MEILIFMQKVGNFWKITILRSPETLVFLVVYWPFSRFFKVPLLFPATGTKSSYFTKKYVSVPESALLGPKCAFLGPLLKTLYKHKLLGGLLGAQNRKSATFHQKSKIPRKNANFRKKAVFCAKSVFSAKRRETSQNVTIFALKTCSKSMRSVLFGPRDPKSTKFLHF